VGAPHSQPATDLARAELDNQVLALKRQDLSFDEIGKHLGISKATAHRAFHRALPRIVEPEATAYRSEHLARLAMAREVVMEIIGTRHVVISNGHIVSEIIGVYEDGKPIYGEPYEDDGVTLAALDRLVKIDEREARLLGIDAEQKVNLSGGIRYEVVGVDGGDLT
jgi:hypothetical protein